MKKLLILLVFLAVVFSAGCVQYGPYPDYESYETVSPPDAEPGTFYLAIGLGTQCIFFSDILYSTVFLLVFFTNISASIL